MRTLLVFGASGAIGRFLLPQTPAHVQVIPVSRVARDGWHRADLQHAHAWPRADTVISLGPLDAFAVSLKRQVDPSLRRVIAFSSMSVESKNDSADEKERDVARRLATGEELLRAVSAERGIALTIFRPTLIYGAGVDRSLAPIARYMSRWRIAPIPVGATGLRQPVHAGDLAAACVAALENPLTYGKTYALGGGEQLTFRAMLMRLRKATRAVPIPISLAALQFVARRARLASVNDAAIERLNMALVANNTDANRDFGYTPRPFIADDVLTAAKTSL